MRTIWLKYEIINLHFHYPLCRCTFVPVQRKVVQSWWRQTVWPDNNTGRPDHNLPVGNVQGTVKNYLYKIFINYRQVKMLTDRQTDW